MTKLAMPFQRWTSYQGHSGVDFPQSAGTPIYATGHGTVGLLRTTEFGGCVTWIDYDDLPRGQGIGYAHQNSFGIAKGARVAPGTIIGRVGYAGRVVPAGPAGAHLHIEVAGRPGEAAVWELFDRDRWWGQDAPAAATPPPFPLPAGSFYGPEGGSARSVSGYHGGGEGLAVWQQRMRDRGWDIEPDGRYGPVGAKTPMGETARIALAFQKEKGLYPDALIGPATWDAAWTSPVT